MAFFVWALVHQLLTLQTFAALATSIFVVVFFSAYGLLLTRDVLEVMVAHRVEKRLLIYRAGNLKLGA